MKICPICMSYMRYYLNSGYVPAYHCDYCNYDAKSDEYTISDTTTKPNPNYMKSYYKVIQ